VNALARISLILAYAILALAAIGRSTYQIATKFGDAPLAYSVSALSAVLYLLIAIALWKGKERLALIGTSVELAGVIIVGTLGYVESSWWPDETVWTGYGSAYGWVPLVLPVLALWALLRSRRSTPVAAS
jgi:cytochrome bd-type quinol oxidase subunit 2